MAITVISVPNALNIAYRPMVYKWSSDASDLQYCIIEVLNDGTRISAKSVQLDAGSSTDFTVNISDIIQDNLGFELNTLGSTGVITPTNDSGRMENITVKVYEVTEDVNGLIVTTYDPDDDNNSNYDFWIGNGITDAANAVNGYNWTESHINYNGFNISDYQLVSSSGKFLNESPLVKNIELGQSEYVGLLNGYNAPVTFDFKLEILTYDSSGALLNTDFINVTDWNNVNSVTYLMFTYLTIGVGTENLINEGVSLTNVAYYTVQLKEGSSEASELRRFNIVGGCDGDVRLHWSNKFGKQESYTFKGNKIESLDHKSKTYLKALGNTYASEITYLKNWISSRLDWMDNNIPGTCVVGLEEELAAITFDVYPNPTSSIINVVFRNYDGNTKQIKLFDGFGKLIYEGATANSMKLDLSNFPNGIYLLEVIDGDMRTSKKVIIQ